MSMILKVAAVAGGVWVLSKMAQEPDSYGSTAELGTFVKGAIVEAADMRGSWGIWRQDDGRYTWQMKFPGRTETRRDLGSLQAAEDNLRSQANAWGWTLHPA